MSGPGASGTRAAPGPLSLRPLRLGDLPAVRELATAGRPPGQPDVGGDLLRAALGGRAAVDGARRAELGPPRTHVASVAGEIVGVVSFARRPADGAGVLLWLYCLDDGRALAAVLVRHALRHLRGARSFEAFPFASALTPGLEGLPVRHRAGTHAALLDAGFTGRDRWGYRYADLPLPGPDTPSPLPDGARWAVREEEGGACRALCLSGPEAQPWGRALLRLPVEGAGLLRRLEVAPAWRRRGLGTALLRGAAELAAGGLGARTLAACVDDDAPAGRLFEGAGLREVDRLFTYGLRQGPARSEGGRGG